MSVGDKVKDWERLVVLTRRDGYFHFPSKSTPGTDRLLERYCSEYGEPFSLLNEPKGARGSFYQE